MRQNQQGSPIDKGVIPDYEDESIVGDDFRTKNIKSPKNSEDFSEIEEQDDESEEEDIDKYFECKWTKGFIIGQIKAIERSINCNKSKI